jgi:thiazole synthase ThiGH ThiG subunit
MQRRFCAQLARETNWLKLEIHPDPKYLMRMQETLKATEALAKLAYRFTLHPC